jgi:hypothetical protein
VRFVDWYLGLDLGQKIVVGVAVPALLFAGTYLVGIIILSVAVMMRADPRPKARRRLRRAPGRGPVPPPVSVPPRRPWPR